MLLALSLILAWIALSAVAVVLCAAARRGDQEFAVVVVRDDAEQHTAFRRAL